MRIGTSFRIPLNHGNCQGFCEADRAITETMKRVRDWTIRKVTEQRKERWSSDKIASAMCKGSLTFSVPLQMNGGNLQNMGRESDLFAHRIQTVQNLLQDAFSWSRGTQAYKGEMCFSKKKRRSENTKIKGSIPTCQEVRSKWRSSTKWSKKY